MASETWVIDEKGGGDYTTFATAWAAKGLRDLPAITTSVTFQIKGVLNAAGVICISQTVGASVADATYFYTIEAYAGYEFIGLRTRNKAKNQTHTAGCIQTGGAAQVISLNVPYTLMRHLHVRNSTVVKALPGDIIRYSADNTTIDSCGIDSCTFSVSPAAGGISLGGIHGRQAAGQLGGCVIRNCQVNNLYYTQQSSAGNTKNLLVRGIYDNVAQDSVEYYNNTVTNIHGTIFQDNPGDNPVNVGLACFAFADIDNDKIKNNVGLEPTFSDPSSHVGSTGLWTFQVSGGTKHSDTDNNASDNSDASDVNYSTGFTGLTAADQFLKLTIGSEDLEPRGFGGSLMRGGIDLSGDFTTDVQGETRVTPWSIGAFQTPAGYTFITGAKIGS